MNQPDDAFALLKLCDPLIEEGLTPTDQHLPAQRTFDRIMPARSSWRERGRIAVVAGAVGAASLAAGASFSVGSGSAGPPCSTRSDQSGAVSLYVSPTEPVPR